MLSLLFSAVSGSETYEDRIFNNERLVIDSLNNDIFFENCTFTENIASGYDSGGAIGMTMPNDAGSVEYKIMIEDCAFYKNRASSGGAIYIRSFFKNGINLEMLNSTFSENTANSYGGAICLISEIGNVIFQASNCTFSMHNATNGGAIYFSTFSKICVQINCTIFANNNALERGAIYFDSISKLYVQISCTVFTNNNATNSGGSIKLSSDSNYDETKTRVIIEETVFSDSNSKYASISVDASIVKIENCNITRCLNSAFDFYNCRVCLMECRLFQCKSSENHYCLQCDSSLQPDLNISFCTFDDCDSIFLTEFDGINQLFSYSFTCCTFDMCDSVITANAESPSGTNYRVFNISNSTISNLRKDSCLSISYPDKIEVIFDHVDFISSPAQIVVKGDSSIQGGERRIDIKECRVIDCSGESPVFDVSAVDSINIESLSVSNSSEAKFSGGEIFIVGMRIDSYDKERVELRSDSIIIEQMDFKQISSGDERASLLIESNNCTILKSIFTGENRTRIDLQGNLRLEGTTINNDNENAEVCSVFAHSGSIVVLGDRFNCFSNLDFNTFFCSDGKFSVFDIDGEEITQLYNYHLCNSSNTFSYSMYFDDMNHFSVSEIFSRSAIFKSSNQPSVSGDFKESGSFSSSTNFGMTDLFSTSNNFGMTDLFSTSARFGMTDLYSSSTRFNASQIYSCSSIFTPNPPEKQKSISRGEVAWIAVGVIALIIIVVIVVVTVVRCQRKQSSTDDLPEEAIDIL